MRRHWGCGPLLLAEMAAPRWMALRCELLTAAFVDQPARAGSSGAVGGTVNMPRTRRPGSSAAIDPTRDIAQPLTDA
jgi:hypothetical protein